MLRSLHSQAQHTNLTLADHVVLLACVCKLTGRST